MFRTTKRPRSSRRRFGVLGFIVLLLPLCYLLVLWLHVTDTRSHRGEGSVSKTFRYSTVPLWVSNYEAPLDQWRFDLERNTRFADRQLGVQLWAWHHSRYQPRLLTSEYIHEHQYAINRFYVVDKGGPPSLLEAMEREFGPDWNSEAHPENRARVFKIVQAHVVEAFLRDLPENAVEQADGTVYSLAPETSGDTVLSLSFVTSETEWRLARDAAQPAVQLWLILSIVLFGFSVASKRREDRDGNRSRGGA